MSKRCYSDDVWKYVWWTRIYVELKRFSRLSWLFYLFWQLFGISIDIRFGHVRLFDYRQQTTRPSRERVHRTRRVSYFLCLLIALQEVIHRLVYDAYLSLYMLEGKAGDWRSGGEVKRKGSADDGKGIRLMISVGSSLLMSAKYKSDRVNEGNIRKKSINGRSHFL